MNTGLTVWRATTDGVVGAGRPGEFAILSPGDKLYLLSVTADTVVAAQIQYGNSALIVVPPNEVFTLSGSDTPDYFDEAFRIQVILNQPPTATSQVQAVAIWGPASRNRPIDIIASLANAICRKMGLPELAGGRPVMPQGRGSGFTR